MGRNKYSATAIYASMNLRVREVVHAHVLGNAETMLHSHDSGGCIFVIVLFIKYKILNALYNFQDTHGSFLCVANC